MDKTLSEKIYETVAKEINSGTTDFQEIAQNVADFLDLEKNDETWRLIQSGVATYNDIHNTEY